MTHYTHLERERVYRVPNNEVPEVVDSLPSPPESIVFPDALSGERRYCPDCGHTCRFPTWWPIGRTGHCTGCERMVEWKRVADGPEYGVRETDE